MDRKDLWRKLTVAWPLALSDGFWSLFGVRPPLLEKLTVKRLLWVFAFVALVTAFAIAGVFTLDVIVPFVGDLLLYFDVASFLLLMVLRREAGVLLRAAVRTARRLVRKGTARMAGARLRRGRPRAVRPHSASSARPGETPDSDGWRAPAVLAPA